MSRDQLTRHNPIVLYGRKKISRSDQDWLWSTDWFIYSANLFTVDSQNADFMHAGKQDYPLCSVFSSETRPAEITITAA